MRLNAYATTLLKPDTNTTSCQRNTQGRLAMTDDIVTYLRASRTRFNRHAEAADEIERLREWNIEITKLIQQAQKCMDIWQKSEDELIEVHHSKCAEQFAEQQNEIERLRADLRRWATTPPNRIVCVKHGEQFICFDEYMDGVYWCEGCRHE
jgi:hypothetical protein